jgi:hypothetical protein
MQDAPPAAYYFHIVPPHTGMLYTPPQFSDHLPICVLLDADKHVETSPALPKNLALDGRSSTRVAQPHKSQKKLTAFFTNRAPPKRTAEDEKRMDRQKKSGRQVIGIEKYFNPSKKSKDGQ